MDASIHLIPAIPADVGLAIHCDGASIWRGRFIEEFAMGEAAVSETLAYLASIPGHGAKMELPHLIGARFAALKVEVGAHGSFAKEGWRVSDTLEEWGDLHQLRAFLCHGSSIVTIDQSGRWRITLSLLTFRGGKPERDVMEVSEFEAALRLEQLSSMRLRLEGQLRGMLAVLRF